MNSDDNYDWLLPETRELLSASIDEKIKAIEEEVFIPYPQANMILYQLEYLHNRIVTVYRQEYLNGQIYTGRALNITIIGASGNGKTTIVKKFEADHPRIRTAGREIMPVIFVNTPPKASRKELLGEILKVMGCEDYYKGNAEFRMNRLLYMLTACGVRTMILDEIHNVMNGTGREIQETCALIKTISEELKITIILLGTEDARDVIKSDSQLESRFPIFDLPKWHEGGEFRTFLKQLESTIPLPKPSDLSSDKIANHLYSISGGVLHPVVRAIKYAAIGAVKAGMDYITLDLLERSQYFVPPVIKDTDSTENEE